MNVRPHRYAAKLRWVGPERGATTSYKIYSREWIVDVEGKPELRGSSDPHFLGDASLYNPEDLLVIALSSCHMLSYLAECARGGIDILSYEDDAEGEMTLIDGVMRFREVVLRPRVAIVELSRMREATELHEKAHHLCFIANSVNFSVRNEPLVFVPQRTA